MLKRTILAAVAACALAAAVQAQENATVVLRSGEKVTGQLVDYGGVGFTVRANNQERQIPANDVAVIDFTGNGDLSDADWSKAGSGPTVWLRNGQTVNGQLYDIAGTQPLKITIKADGGNREFSSTEVGRIILARPNNTGAAASGGAQQSLGVPSGTGIAVPATQAWTPTGITVRRGDQLTINATGEVRLSTDASDLASPAGSKAGRTSPNAPLPQNLAGALIARVGNSEPFPIGDTPTVTVPASGQLFLGINDDHLADNQGGFRVTVQRASRRR